MQDLKASCNSIKFGEFWTLTKDIARMEIYDVDSAYVLLLWIH